MSHLCAPWISRATNLGGLNKERLRSPCYDQRKILMGSFPALYGGFAAHRIRHFDVCGKRAHGARLAAFVGIPWSIGARCRPAEKGQDRSPPPCRKRSSAHKKWAWARAAYGPCRSTVATTVRADRDPVSSAFHDTRLARTAREATAGYGSRRLHTAGRSTDQRWCPAPGRSSRGLLLSQKA